MSRRRGWFGRVKRGCYQSNRFCGPIQGDMRTKSKVLSPKSKVQSLGEEGRHSRFRVRGSRFKVQAQRTAAVGYLSRFLCAAFALALLVTGCAGPRPLKGGKAVTTHKPTGVIEQTVVQGDNASQATKQDQESVKVRTYTVPAGSRVEQSQTPAAHPQRNYQPSTLNLSTCSPQLSTLNRPAPSS